ncbi:hypothetical protein CFAM422_000452 [Trichoderma lentiforme]|uniref:Uncharacterized protein n=1 Tax=Trichoderma lentiforme TaxID=1567552 RepID=A0A9P4XQB1_9HYPO|nr:hypothetical protein CFAM422_000452 [Trichoderma lentiforme]
MKHDFAPNASSISALAQVNGIVKHIVKASFYYDTEPRKGSSCILTDLKQVPFLGALIFHQAPVSMPASRASRNIDWTPRGGLDARRQEAVDHVGVGPPGSDSDYRPIR